MKSFTRSYIALILTFIVIVSTGGLGVTGSVAATPIEATFLTETATVAQIDPAIAQRTGTVELFIRLPEATLPPGADRETVIELLKTHADRTQAPITEFAAQREGVTVLNTFWLTNAILLDVDTDVIPITVLASIPGVERIHGNYEVTADVPVSTPLSAQVEVGVEADDNHTPVTYGLDRVNAPDVWDTYGTTGEGVTVAVLDSGVDANHPDITLFRTDPTDPTYQGGWIEFNSIGNPLVGSTPVDTSGHGTHVSGTVAGGAASGRHIGVAPGVTLIHARVLPSIDPNTGLARGNTAQIYAGMEWAVESEADVMSMSLGATGYSLGYIPHVRNAEAAGTLVVGSIGNTEAGTSGSPGNVYETFSVGASDQNDGIAFFSSGERINTDTDWGPGTMTTYGWPTTYVVPDVSAPGVGILSAEPGGYVTWSGTSMAAPHVSGAAALVIAAADRDLTPGEVRAALVASATKPAGAPVDPDPRYGEGIVDALAAVEYVLDDTTPTPTPPPSGDLEPNNDFTIPTPLALGTPVSTTLETADVDVFAVSMTAGDPYEVQYDTVSETSVSAVVVYGPDQEMVTSEYVGSGAPVELYGRAVATGTYYVQVVSIQGVTGAYTLAVVGDGGTLPTPTPTPEPPETPTPTPTPTPTDPNDPNEPNNDRANAVRINSGQTLRGNVSGASDVDWFVVDPVDRGIVEVRRPTVRGTGNLIFTFYDENGSLTDQHPITSKFLLFDIDGLGYVEIESETGVGGGPYTVQFVGSTQAEVEPNGAPADANSVNPNLARSGSVIGADTDYYVIQTTGSTAEFRLMQTSGGPFEIRLFTAQQQPIGQPVTVSSFFSSQLTGTQPGQTFYVTVEAADGATNGQYVFASLGPTPPAIASGSEVDAAEVPTLEPNDGDGDAADTSDATRETTPDGGDAAPDDSSADGTEDESSTAGPAAKDADQVPIDISVTRGTDVAPTDLSTAGDRMDSALE